MNKILSAPVVDEEGEYCGAVSVNDVSRRLLAQPAICLAEPRHSAVRTVVALQVHTQATLRMLQHSRLAVQHCPLLNRATLPCMHGRSCAAWSATWR